ncbi:hypothetical protein GCM10009577_64440 [Streptomyces javensis]
MRDVTARATPTPANYRSEALEEESGTHRGGCPSLSTSYRNPVVTNLRRASLPTPPPPSRSPSQSLPHPVAPSPGRSLTTGRP